MLINSWTFCHNFLTKDPRTGLTPVEAHLGLWRAANITSFNQCIDEAPELRKDSTVGTMQQILHKAYERKKMADNISEAANKQRRKQLNEKRTVLEPEDIISKFPPLTIILLKTDLTMSKVDKRSPNLGPFFVISHKNGMVNMMELKTGKILRRSHRNITKLLPSDELLSMGAFPQWLDSHPRSIVDNETTTTTVTAHEAAEEYRTALGNIAELYSFLSPILPTVAETERTINVYRQEGQKESNSHNETRPPAARENQNEEEQQEEEDQEISSSEEEEEEEREEDDGLHVTFKMSHLSKEEEEEENRRIEEDTTYDVTPEVSVQVTEDRNHPASEAKAAEPHKQKKKEVAIRQPRRSARPRADIPVRFRT